MRGVLLAIKSYESHGREHPAVVNVVQSSLVDLGNLAVDLPPVVTESEPAVDWEMIRGLREHKREDPVAPPGRLWSTVDGLLPLIDTLLGIWLRMPHQPEPTGWFQDEDSGGWDRVRGDERGSIGRESTVHIDGTDYPIRVRSHGGIEIQLSPAVGAALAGDVPLSTMFRRAGIGRVRKDVSTPLEPDPDRVWIQAKLGHAVLVLRRGDGPEHAAFFRLGELDRNTRALSSRSQVLFFLADDYLPEARWSRMLRLVREQEAFGALIASTIDG